LRTARRELRPFALSDAPAIQAVYSDPEVMEHVGNGLVGDLEETEAMLRDYMRTRKPTASASRP
jgi:Acetyltransferase (GNAT) domain